MLKKAAFLIEDLGWNLKCRYGYWLHGPYGLCRVIEKIPFRFLVKYLRKYGAQVGDDCIIERGIRIHRPFGKMPFENLSIGKNVYLGHNVLLDLTQKVIINDFVCIGADTQIWTHSGYYDNTDCKYLENTGAVLIKEYAIIYSSVILAHGITVGKMSRTGANSFVNKNIEDNIFAAGTPVKTIELK